MQDKSKTWLREKALPLWLTVGVDRDRGGFFESLSLTGEPQVEPKRMMVQARQIFVCRTALDLGMASDVAPSALRSGLAFVLKHGSMPNGAFAYSVECDGRLRAAQAELYSQAFVLFGLACAYAIEKTTAVKTRAVELLGYLRHERKAGPGFTEVKDGKILFEANPHMHLFEAAVAWMEVDADPLWRQLADEVLQLCLTQFIDEKTGALAEHMTSDWQAQRVNGNFVFEPGHHFEWVWLLGRYSKLTKVDLLKVRRRLFDLGERGVDERGFAIDEMWSDVTPKLRSARFWPQCERIKAAVQLGEAKAADQAMEALFRYLETERAGLWYDTRLESGEFKPQPVKASSLYHIIGAMSEYIRYR